MPVQGLPLVVGSVPGDQNPLAKSERGQLVRVVIWATVYSVLNSEGRGMGWDSDTSGL